MKLYSCLLVPLGATTWNQNHFLNDQAVGLVLKRIKATSQASSFAAQRRSHALRNLENKTDRWNKMDERRRKRYLSSQHRCVCPASLSFFFFFISHISPPTHWELLRKLQVSSQSVARSAFRLAGVKRGREVFRGKKNGEDEGKTEIPALQQCCGVCATLFFVCLAITYSAQGHSSRGWARASVKTENNEATALQRMPFSPLPPPFC